MSPSDCQYRNLHIYAQNGSEECNQVVDVFIRTGRPADLLCSFELSARTDKWPTDGACIRVDVSKGLVRLCDSYKDYSIEFSATIQNGLFSVLKIKIRPGASARGAIPISVDRCIQEGSERPVMMSKVIYVGSPEVSDLPEGLVVDKSRARKKASAGPRGVKLDATPTSRQSSPARSVKSEADGGADSAVYVIDTGISKFNKKVKMLPFVSEGIDPNDIIIAKTQSDVDPLDNVIGLASYRVSLKQPLQIVSFKSVDEKYQFVDKSPATLLELVLHRLGDKRVVVVRIVEG